jgi:predicted glycogen debranching enzyme
MNTRRYHGLLVAAMHPPLDRYVLLSKFEETLQIGRRYDLSTNQYPGIIHPAGYGRLREFRLDPMPVWTFEVNGVTLEKSVFMLHGENAVAVSYRVLGPRQPGLWLELRPLIAFRAYHSLTHANAELNADVCSGNQWCSVTPYRSLPTLYFNHDGADLQTVGAWYYQFEYEEERKRGLDYREDLFCPFGLRFSLDSGAANLIVSTEQRDPADLERYRKEECARRSALVAGWAECDPFVSQLLIAADHFRVRRGENLTSIIAGYHWHTDWGRDTMVSLTGLTLVPRRFDEARKTLLAFAQSCDRGMIPNRFVDHAAQPEYHTADAALWFIQAVYSLVTHTGDYEFVRRRLYGTLQEILRWHLEGTRHNIKADVDGLLHAGEPGLQLTWMDAKIDGRVVTPRIGKPVEVQALWYNALCVLHHLASRFEDAELVARIAPLAEKARQSFLDQFWNPGTECLYDCVLGEDRDGAIRPNQIFAASLPFSMLPNDRMRKVVEAVRRELLTPYGLRTLSPRDAAYVGNYRGDQLSRDSAYHQGTVWPWLLGPYITARMRAYGGTAEVRSECVELLNALRGHLADAGLGCVSELFDGDPPHAPGGAIAQAWSVAELLRAAVEDLSLTQRLND